LHWKSAWRVPARDAQQWIRVLRLRLQGIKVRGWQGRADGAEIARKECILGAVAAQTYARTLISARLIQHNIRVMGEVLGLSGPKKFRRRLQRFQKEREPPH